MVQHVWHWFLDLSLRSGPPRYQQVGTGSHRDCNIGTATPEALTISTAAMPRQQFTMYTPSGLCVTPLSLDDALR